MTRLVNKDWKTGKESCIVFLLLLAIFILSRVVFLDRDLPPGAISSYVQIDEFYYTIPAFNLYHYGEINHKVVPFIEDKNTPINVIENAATFGSLSIFGNNYYGLRMASVFSALLIFILLYLILRKVLYGNLELHAKEPADERGLKRSYILYFLLVYVLFDFSFLVAGRVAEPTIFRMLAVMIVIYLGSLSKVSQPLESNWHTMFLGFLALAVMVFGYMYNAFIFFALGSSVFMWAYKGGRINASKKVAYFLLGSLLCLLSYQIFAQVIYHSSLLEVYKTLFPFQSRMGVGMTSIELLKHYFGNIAFLFMTNIFRFNVVLLFVFLVSLPIFVQKIKLERSNFDILIANLWVFLMLQSVVINDWFLRKLIIMLPLIMIIIAIAYSYSGTYFKGMRSQGRGEMKVKIYWFLAWGFTLFVFVGYLMPTITGPAAGATGDLKYLNVAVFLTVSLMMIISYLFAVHIRPIGVFVCLLIILVPNLCLDAKYVFLNRTYYFRDSMIAMSDKVDGKIIAGGCSYGFRLYNKSIPVLNFYLTGGNFDENQARSLYHQNFDRVFASNIASYSIAFIQVDHIDPLFQADAQAADYEGYMYNHGLQLEEDYKFHGIIAADIGLFEIKTEAK